MARPWRLSDAFWRSITDRPKYLNLLGLQTGTLKPAFGLTSGPIQFSSPFPALELIKHNQARLDHLLIQQKFPQLAASWTIPAADASGLFRQFPTPPTYGLKLPALDSILKDLAKRFPSNWPDDLEDFALVQTIVEDEGIPLVYIPRADIVSELMAEADRDGWVGVLVRRTHDILDDCALALEHTLCPEVEDQRSLILEAIDTFKGGFSKAALSLCIDVCDTLIGAHIDGVHERAKNKCIVNDLQTAFASGQLRIVLGAAPVVNLLTSWNPKSKLPRPVPLSRHVITHQAHPDHFTPGNTIIGVMVATSLMLSLDERYTL